MTAFFKVVFASASQLRSLLLVLLLPVCSRHHRTLRTFGLFVTTSNTWRPPRKHLGRSWVVSEVQHLCITWITSSVLEGTAAVEMLFQQLRDRMLSALGDYESKWLLS